MEDTGGFAEFPHPQARAGTSTPNTALTFWLPICKEGYHRARPLSRRPSVFFCWFQDYFSLAKSAGCVRQRGCIQTHSSGLLRTSSAMQEAEDLAGGHRGPPPEHAHARALANIPQEGRDPRVVCLLGDRTAGDARGRHATPEQLPGADVRGHHHDALSLGMGGVQQSFVARVEIDERADVHPVRARGLEGGPPEV